MMTPCNLGNSLKKKSILVKKMEMFFNWSISSIGEYNGAAPWSTVRRANLTPYSSAAHTVEVLFSYVFASLVHPVGGVTTAVATCLSILFPSVQTKRPFEGFLRKSLSWVLAIQRVKGQASPPQICI